MKDRKNKEQKTLLNGEKKEIRNPLTGGVYKVRVKNFPDKKVEPKWGKFTFPAV